jgi:glutamate-1-semialdehyde 2,1-aminomutase
MLLMCPATSARDVDRHTAVLARFIDLLRGAGAI